MSKITIIEGNSNDKDNVRVLMVKGEKGDPGEQGPIGDNQLTIGTVTSGQTASAEITGRSPNQTLNLVLPKGDKGDQGDTGVPDINIIFPVGSLYLTATNINPSTFLGGTWERVAEGLFLAGVGTGTDKNNVTKTFDAGANDGEYEHTQTTGELATHKHNITDPGHRHNVAYVNGYGSGTNRGVAYNQIEVVQGSGNVASATSTTGVTINNSGSGQAMNVTNPSFGVYVWKRTA